MKKSTLTIAGVMMFSSLTSCSTFDLEPTDWQKDNFKHEVRLAMKKAINAPGIDNGSTLIVSLEGDTILAPRDSLKAANPTRTVYVEVISPDYPKGRLTDRKLEMLSVAGLVGVVVLAVLLVLLGVFITIWRRQSARNSILEEAVSKGYQLPESYFTGSPSQPTINYMVVKDGQTVRTEKGHNEGASDSEMPPKYVQDREPDSDFRDTVNNICKVGSAERIRQFRNGFVISGIGLIVFIGFCAGGAEPVGIIAGGTLIVIGLSKIITVFISNRL